MVTVINSMNQEYANAKPYCKDLCNTRIYEVLYFFTATQIVQVAQPMPTNFNLPRQLGQSGNKAVQKSTLNYCFPFDQNNIYDHIVYM